MNDFASSREIGPTETDIAGRTTRELSSWLLPGYSFDHKSRFFVIIAQAFGIFEDSRRVGSLGAALGDAKGNI
jgi:hypothetical protein